MCVDMFYSFFIFSWLTFLLQPLLLQPTMLCHSLASIAWSISYFAVGILCHHHLGCLQKPIQLFWHRHRLESADTHWRNHWGVEPVNQSSTDSVSVSSDNSEAQLHSSSKALIRTKLLVPTVVTSSKMHAWIGFLSFYLPFFSILTLLSLGITSKANQRHLNPCLRLYLSREPKIRHLISGVDLESRHPEKDSGTESLARHLHFWCKVWVVITPGLNQHH